VKKVFTLIELVTVIIIIGILAAISIPKLSQSYRIGNESNAQATLKLISAAIENYVAAKDAYPTAEANLTGANPAYLNRSYCNQKYQGYNYGCDLQSTGYSLNAAPISCGASGSQKFTITTGGNLTAAACP